MGYWHLTCWDQHRPHLALYSLSKDSQVWRSHSLGFWAGQGSWRPGLGSPGLQLLGHFLLCPPHTGHFPKGDLPAPGKPGMGSPSVFIALGEGRGQEPALPGIDRTRNPGLEEVVGAGVRGVVPVQFPRGNKK